MKAILTVKELTELTAAAPDPWALCSFMEGYRRGSEMEWMITETLHATKHNLKNHGEPFSFRGVGVLSVTGGGLADNRTALEQLLEEGYFMEEDKQSTSFKELPKGINPDDQGCVTVIFLTQKLVEKLRGFLKLKKTA